MAFSSPDASSHKVFQKKWRITISKLPFIYLSLSVPSSHQKNNQLPLRCPAWQNSTCCICNLVPGLLWVITSYCASLISIHVKRSPCGKPRVTSEACNGQRNRFRHTINCLELILIKTIERNNFFLFCLGHWINSFQKLSSLTANSTYSSEALRKKYAT